MSARRLVLFTLTVFVSACAPNNTVPPSVTRPSETATPAVALESATPVSTATTVEEFEYAGKVAAFYYPWYGNPETDGRWIHWGQNNHIPPEDIGADYFPSLGAYSSNDPAVVAQHMDWLRQAGIGVIITSWWGQGSREDQVVPLLLRTAEKYGIKVAFHIEPYNGRTADGLVLDIQYLYETYGSSPAFFRSTATSQYSPDSAPKGMFFVWNIGSRGAEGERVEAEYWRDALDTIHALPDGALIIANTTDGSWVRGGHFDGLYNYATLHLEESNGFAWARSLPPDSLFVPSVIPGFSARRVAYPEDTFVERQDGGTYNAQWTAALGAGVQPELVTITSFNEWHEGSIIEPPRFGVDDGQGQPYADFGSLPADGYLDLTRRWAEDYLATSWPPTYRARLQVRTTSDWTTLEVVSGGAWIRPELLSATISAAKTGMEAGDRFLLTQSLEDAKAGNQVEMVWDVLFTGLAAGQDLILQIDRGNLGKTQVVFSNYLSDSPVEVNSFEWGQVTTGRNSYQIAIPAELLTEPSP